MLADLIDAVVSFATAPNPFARRERGVRMMSLGAMSLDRPPIYNPQFTPLRRPQIADQD